MKRVLAIFALFFLIACTGQGGTQRVGNPLLPTLQPTAAGVVVEVKEASTSPTPEGSEEAVSKEPGASEPTAIPDSLLAAVQITTPELTAISGETVRLGGRLEASPGLRVEAIVQAPDGTLIGAAPVEGGDFGTFAVEVPVATWFAGSATATVTIFNEAGEALKQSSRPIQIYPNVEQERYLALYRPEEGQTAGVSGTYLFFDGYAQRPAGFRVAITLLTADCRTRLARESYAMRGSGYWQGFIVVPEEVSGPICARISAGEAGTPERREIQVPIEVRPAGEDAGSAVLIGNPPPNAEVEAGRTLTAYGTAYRPAGGNVQLTLFLGDGTIAATGTARVNRYGYWETDLLLPVELNEEALLRATTGPLEEPLAVDEIFVEIVDR